MPMPTVVKGAPVASCIPPHENRAKPRVVPDEDPAESLRRVVPDENRGSVAPMQRAIRESGNPPTRTQNHTVKRAYRQERYTGNGTYGFSAQMSSPWADKQSPPGKNALEKQTAESKRLRSRKKRGLYFYSTTPKPEKQRDGMQICNLFTQPAKPKSKVLLPSYVYCIYCLYN